MVGSTELLQVQDSDRRVDHRPGDAGAIDEIRFRDYRLLPAARILLKGRAPVAIGSRAFDILHVLASARGSIVGKREIVGAVWPTTIVEESNLRFQIAQLRKVLGRDQELIKTIPGRGYLFAWDTLTDVQVRPTRQLRLLEVSARGSVVATPALHLVCPSSAERPAPGDADRSADVQRLLQQLLDSLRIEEGDAVVICVRAPH